MDVPSVSVVVPLYNHERYVAAALESITAQSLPPTEVIVIDDGSSDGSAAVVEQCARSDPRIRLWRQPNAGAHAAINAGMRHARGEAIAILNSDDVYAPERLRECAEVLATHRDVAAVATALQFIDDDGRAIRYAWYDAARADHDDAGDLALALVNGNFIMTTSNIVVRRSVVSELGGFAGLRYAHDVDFLLRMLVTGKRIHLIDRPLLHYRIHARNTIKEEHRNVRVEWASVAAYFAHELFARREAGAETWQYYQKLLQVWEKHQLTRMVAMFLGFFATLPAGTAASDAYLRDDDFRRRITELA